MSHFSLIYLGIFSLLISILSFFNIIYAYYFNIYLSLDSYFYSLILSLLFGLIFIFKKKDNLKISIYHKILTVILGYFLLPLIISIPFYLSIYNISFLDSYFETVSGFTSTGFTIFDNIKHLDQSLILWRSSSQWIGGLYFLSSIILLIDIFDNNLKKSLTNFITFDSTETLKQLTKILILYSFLTLLIFLVLKVSDIRTFDSFNLSMSLISSGGFLPFNNLSIVLNSNIKEVIFSLLMLISFFSIFLSYNLIFLKNRNLNFFQEDLYLLIYLVSLTLVFFSFLNFEYDLSLLFFSLSSSVSNIGFSLESSPKNLSFIFLILVIIGGSFFSTSSGLRLLKIYSLIKYSLNEILSYAKPNSIFANKFHFINLNIEQKDINKYFLSILIFVISFLVITSLLTIFGTSFENSFKLGILTLMNTVNSAMYGLNNFDFAELNSYSKVIMMIFMIVGRVELLTILIIAKKFLFKN
mgnify:CR=1 FL=1